MPTCVGIEPQAASAILDFFGILHPAPIDERPLLLPTRTLLLGQRAPAGAKVQVAAATQNLAAPPLGQNFPE